MKYGVDRGEVLRYLGYAGQAMEPALYDRIDGIIERCERELDLKSTVAYFDVEVHGGSDAASAERGEASAADDLPRCGAKAGDAGRAVRGRSESAPYVDVLGASLRLDGFDIVEHLRGARGCALLACTLGAKSEQELARLKVSSPLDALVYDAACSALVERVADATEAQIVAQAAQQHLYANWRYSPGYGDLPLSVQPRFLAVLRAFETMGLSVTDTDLLLPTKSVTAVVGLFEDPPAGEKPRSCGSCHMKEFCAIRAAGKVCHG